MSKFIAFHRDSCCKVGAHGSTHRWLVGRIVCYLDFMDIMDSMVGMDVMVRMDLLDSMELMVAGVALNLRTFYL